MRCRNIVLSYDYHYAITVSYNRLNYDCSMNFQIRFSQFRATFFSYCSKLQFLRNRTSDVILLHSVLIYVEP